jgi:hypothetical protein
MHQYADIYLLQLQTLHVSGVTAQSTKLAPTSPNQATVEGRSGTKT